MIDIIIITLLFICINFYSCIILIHIHILWCSMIIIKIIRFLCIISYIVMQLITLKSISINTVTIQITMILIKLIVLI